MGCLLGAIHGIISHSVSRSIWEVAAANEGFGVGTGVLTQFLDKLGDEFMVTERMLCAAVGNTEAGTEILDFLLRYGQSSGGFRITERVLEIAAGNEKCGEDLIDMLLQYRGDNLQLTEPVARAATANSEGGYGIMELPQTRTGSGPN